MHCCNPSKLGFDMVAQAYVGDGVHAQHQGQWAACPAPARHVTSMLGVHQAQARATMPKPMHLGSSWAWVWQSKPIWIFFFLEGFCGQFGDLKSTYCELVRDPKASSKERVTSRLYWRMKNLKSISGEFVRDSQALSRLKIVNP